MNEPEHEHWMRQALVMGARNPRAPFGALVVHRTTQSVLAAGTNHATDSPIWHGEMDALGQLESDAPFAESVLYTTAEPCPMCQAAICWAGIPLVVYGTSVPYLKSLGWGQFGLRASEVAASSHRPCQVLGGILEPECNALFRAAGRPDF